MHLHCALYDYAKEVRAEAPCDQSRVQLCYDSSFACGASRSTSTALVEAVPARVGAAADPRCAVRPADRRDLREVSRRPSTGATHI
jgi:hypothetical protein